MRKVWAYIYLWRSDATPPSDQLEAIVHEVHDSFGAVWLDDDEDYDLRLRDGFRLEVWFDGPDDGLHYTLEAAHEAAFELIHAVADRTACFTTFDPTGDPRSLPSTGGIRPDEAPAFEGHVVALAGRREFVDWLRDETTKCFTRAQPALISSKLRLLWRRLSDALFGKEM